MNGAKNNLVADNVISGNANEGLRIADVGTTGNLVQGNKVGTNAAGSAAVGNGFGGVTIFGGATGNTVGGTTAAARNILSGNGTAGLAFGDVGTTNNFAYGNFIGTNPTGAVSVPNGYAGVYLTSGASANHLGDLQPGTGNVISGNNSYGVYVANTARFPIVLLPTSSAEVARARATGSRAITRPVSTLPTPGL